AKNAYERRWSDYTRGPGSHEYLYRWSMRWRNSALTMATSKRERIAAEQAHLRRMGTLQALIRTRFTGVAFDGAYAAAYYKSEAELLTKIERQQRREIRDSAPTKRSRYRSLRVQLGRLVPQGK